MTRSTPFASRIISDRALRTWSGTCAVRFVADTIRERLPIDNSRRCAQQRSNRASEQLLVPSQVLRAGDDSHPDRHNALNDSEALGAALTNLHCRSCEPTCARPPQACAAYASLADRARRVLPDQSSEQRWELLGDIYNDKSTA